jgi:hypothetical protein
MEPTMYPAITLKNNSSSKDEGKTKKFTLMKLCHENWTEWKRFFKNLLIGCGHEEIFDNAWCLEHTNEKIFQKKSALAFTLLHSCLSANLKTITAASGTFSQEMEALGKTCREKLLIKLADKLYALIFCDFVPGTSIASHITQFQSLYASLKSDLVRNDNMKVTTTMVGIFFLESFRNNDSLFSFSKICGIWSHSVLRN